MGKWKQLLDYRGDKDNTGKIQEQWGKISKKASQGLSSAFTFIKSHKMRFAVSMMIIGSLAGASFLGNQYVKANTNIIYHVIYEGKQIGTVDSPEVVEGWILKQYNAAKALYPNTDIDLSPEINYQSEKLFKGKADNESTIQSLSALMEVRADAIEIVIDGKFIGYAPDLNSAKVILNNIQREYTSGMRLVAKDKVHIASVDMKESQLVEVGFVEKVELNPVKVEPGQVMDPKSIEDKIRLGEEEQVTHVVQEGDCLSCIASQYEISVDQILQLNPELDEGKLLRIGQELVVTALQPELTVRTVETKSTTETVAHKVEYEKDASLPKGVQKVKKRGTDGQKSVVYRIVKENGLVVEKAVESERVLVEPVAEVIRKGTKVVPGIGSGKFAWPVIGGTLTSRYGKRWGRLHAGIDLVSSNRKILAADQGRVVEAGWDGDYGRSVVIDHGNGFRTRYAHLSKIQVSRGQIVEKGQHIGTMGNTGRSYGTHLHFEIIRNGVPINPLKYL